MASESRKFFTTTQKYVDGVALVDQFGNRTGDVDNPFLIGFGNSPSIDAFSRQRVANPSSLLDAQHHYGQVHYNFVGVATGAATLTDQTNSSSLLLSVTSAIGDKYVNRSRRHYYVAGQSHFIAMTGVFGAPTAGIRKSIGFNDDDDGIFFQQDDTDGLMYLCVRSSTSGTPTLIEKVVQSSWNKDTMDGNGPSGITVDWTKAQIFLFDLQWLGVGRVRYYLDIDGKLIEIHESNHANLLTEVYMQTPHLNCSYEIENVSAVAGDSLTQICSSVFTEGAVPKPQVRVSTSNGVTGVSCAAGVYSHVLSIRPAALFQTRANKCMARPIAVQVFVVGNTPCHYHIYEDATLTTPTWTAVANPTSMMEDCQGTAAAGFTGGRVRSEGYASGNAGQGGSISIVDETNYRIQIDPSGTPDILTIAAAGIGGAATVYASITWEEYHSLVLDYLRLLM